MFYTSGAEILLHFCFKMNIENLQEKIKLLFTDILTNSKNFSSQVSLLKRKDEIIKNIEEIQNIIDNLLMKVNNEK